MSNAADLPIAGFRIRDFLTLRDVAIEPAGDLSVVCGPNNVGKSSFLRAISLAAALAQVAHGQRSQERLDGLVGTSARVGLAIDPISSNFVELLEGQAAHMGRTSPEALAASVKEDHGLIWLNFTHSDQGWELHSGETLEPLNETLNRWASGGAAPSGWKAVARIGGTNAVRNGTQYSFTPDWLKHVSKSVLRPQVHVIPDVRRTVSEPLRAEDLWRLSQATARSTAGHRVANWAGKLEQVLRDVFGQDVHYEVRPTEGSGDFRLRIDGQDDVPLDHVGAGVREVVAVAYAALQVAGPAVLAIEEPENCLHPGAARRLVQSLPRRTGAQLFVSTHSSAVVNANPDTVVHLARTSEGTTAEQVDDAPARYEAVRALGYAPADLVLAPVAVWVEGPSDRMYFASWLRSHGLTEGIDYQIMFYGGALAAHVTTNGYAPPGSSLAAIRSLGRRCAVIADSDRSAKGARLKKHVQRFREELEPDPHGHLLISWGREVENYIPPKVVNDIRRSLGLSRIRESDYRYARVVDSRVAAKLRKTGFAERALKLTSGEVPEAATQDVRRLATFIRESVPH